MKKIFLSNENLTMLLEIITKKIANSFKITQTNFEYFKNQIQTITKQFYYDRKSLRIPKNTEKKEYIKKLNKHVLDFIIPNFMNYMKLEKNKKENIAMKREIDNNMRRPVLMDRPENVLNLKTQDDVNKQFDQLQQSRMITVNKPPEINFQDNPIPQTYIPQQTTIPQQTNNQLNEDNIKIENEKSLNKRLKELQEERNIKMSISKSPTKQHTNIQDLLNDKKMTDNNYSQQQTLITQQQQTPIIRQQQMPIVQQQTPISQIKSQPFINSNQVLIPDTKPKQSIILNIDSRERNLNEWDSGLHFIYHSPISLQEFTHMKILSCILPFHNKIVQEPYLLLAIKEIDGTTFGTTHKYITKLYNDPRYLTTNDFACNDFINQIIDNQVTVPCKLQKTISFKIINYNNELVSIGDDILYIKKWGQDRLGLYFTIFNDDTIILEENEQIYIHDLKYTAKIENKQQLLFNNIVNHHSGCYIFPMYEENKLTKIYLKQRFDFYTKKNKSIFLKDKTFKSIKTQLQSTLSEKIAEQFKAKSKQEFIGRIIQKSKQACLSIQLTT